MCENLHLAFILVTTTLIITIIVFSLILVILVLFFVKKLKHCKEMRSEISPPTYELVRPQQPQLQTSITTMENVAYGNSKASD